MQNERIKVDYSTFSVRAVTALKLLGIEYIDEMANLSTRKLRNTRNVGERTVNEIVHTAKSHGIELSEKLNSYEKQRMIRELQYKIIQIRNSLTCLAKAMDEDDE